jgi:hypothetical protein
MADVTSVVSADAAKVTAAVQADVSKVEADASKVVAEVKSTWTTKVWPWVTHAAATVGGYLLAHFVKF